MPLFDKQDYKNLLINIIAGMVISVLTAFFLSNPNTVIVINEPVGDNKPVHNIQKQNEISYEKTEKEDNSQSYKETFLIEFQSTLNYYSNKSKSFDNWYINRQNIGGWNYILLFILYVIILFLFLQPVFTIILLAKKGKEALSEKANTYIGCSIFIGLLLAFILDAFVLKFQILSFLTFSTYIIYLFNTLTIIFLLYSFYFFKKYTGYNTYALSYALDKIEVKIYMFFWGKRYPILILMVFSFLLSGYLNYYFKII